MYGVIHETCAFEVLVNVSPPFAGSLTGALKDKKVGPSCLADTNAILLLSESVIVPAWESVPEVQ